MPKEFRLRKYSSYGPKITEKQFHLLSWVYVQSFEEDQANSVLWSPKAYLGRKPAPAEAATLSKRVSKLVERQLLAKNGRKLAITELGKTSLYAYAGTHVGGLNEELRARIRVDETRILSDALEKVIKAIGSYYDHMELDREGMLEMQGKLRLLLAVLAKHIETNLGSTNKTLKE